jgi:hypothetical protein
MIRLSQARPLLIAAIGVPVLFLAIIAVQTRIDARTSSASGEDKELLINSGPLVKQLSLGYDSLLADIYWTRAVQYYGTRVGTPDIDFPLLWPLLDVTTTLDPKLVVAYRFGGIFLSEPTPTGAGRTDLAIKLIQRGIAANPDEWRLGTDLGFLYYWRLKDYPNAAAAYLQTSQNPKAPPWVKLMAARISEKGGSFETSQAIWYQIYQSSKDPSIRKMAIDQLQGIKAQEDESNLDQLAETYRQRFGRYPNSSGDLNDAGLVGGIPVDPLGFAYIFDPNGKSHLDPKSPVVVEPPPPVQPQN